ncbi:MAG: polysaccharide biosynthesis C-terminal domain-containing protein [Lentimicrobiaceae bacterium]|jgi:O-antigen/teichoic acid export membrane protein|nr:polysaccharide biosynthesis C-terminal domain-containing protein [Lentimicrobiaceae bacterium]
MNQSFVRNLLLLLFINILIKPFWVLGIDLTVQNTVGDSVYGFYFSIYNFSYLFYILLDLGITNYNNRNIAQNNQLLSKHFVGISQVRIMLAMLYFMVIFVVGWAIDYNAQQLKMLVIVGFNQVLLSFILYLRSNISGLLLFKTDSLLSVLDKLLMIIICSFLLWSGLFAGKFKIEWYVYSQTAAYLITVGLALFIVIKKAGKITISFNLPFIIVVIRQSLPYALLALLMSFYNRLEPVLIERLLPSNESLVQTGIYSRAFRLLDAGNNISLLFSVILLPLFASMIKKKESINDLARLSFSMIISMTGIIALLAICYSTEIMTLLRGSTQCVDAADYAQRLYESAFVFRVLMGSFVAISITYIFGTLLTANGNLKMLNIVAATGVVVNFLMNFILIPRYQAIGAAFSSVSVQVLTAVIQYLLAAKVFKLKFSSGYWIHLLAFFVLIVVCTYLVNLINIHWLWRFSISLSLNVCFVFASKLLNIKEMLWILGVAKKSKIK